MHIATLDENVKDLVVRKRIDDRTEKPLLMTRLLYRGRV